MKSMFCLSISYAANTLSFVDGDMYGVLATTADSPLSIILVTNEIDDEIEDTSSNEPL